MPVKRPRRTRGLLAATTAAALAVTLASCASSSRDTASIAEPGDVAAPRAPCRSVRGRPAAAAPVSRPSTDGTFIFGAEGAPSMFDPLYATDGETFKVTRQMTEGLVTYTPGTADIEPSLAESWEPSEDGLTWTFKIRQGVKFHDGTALDAAAVCYNFDRMYSQTGAGATQAQYWSDTMGGFKDQVDDAGAPVPSIYASCTAPDAGTAVITLTRVTSKFPNILGLPSFSIQSPTALEQYDANNVVAEGDSFVVPGLRTGAPDRHRAVHLHQVRQRERHRHPRPQRGLLGREGQVQDADLQDHPGRVGPQAGAAGRHHRRLRPAEPR